MRTLRIFCAFCIPCTFAALAAFSTSTFAAEVTIQNDSVTDFSGATIVYGFQPGEKAAAWLTSTCTGSVRAAQIFWRSPNADQPITIANTIEVSRAGTFPTPGAVAATIGGPVLTDGVINEFRYLDENNTIPLDVAVAQNEVFVVSLEFADAPAVGGASVVRDVDGCQAGKNGLLADVGSFTWFSSCSLGLQGDWVIRARVDCQTGVAMADVAVTMTALPTSYTPGSALGYTITVVNAGPNPSPNTSITDTFPSALTGVTWTCASSGGATCTSGGSGNINQLVSIPAAGQVVYTVTATVSSGATGTISNSANALVIPPVTDPVSTNNSASADVSQDTDVIFKNGFEN